MNTEQNVRIGATLQPPLSDAVVQLRMRCGYGDTELIKRGIRLIAREEGIPLGESL